MKHFMNSLTIKQKILLLVLIPAIQLIYYITTVLYMDYSIYSNNKELLKLGHYTKHISKVVNELQKERGMSAGYIGSDGKKFTNISSQYQSTNKEFDDFKNIIKKYPLDTMPDNMKNYIDLSLDKLQQLNSIREQVRSLNIPLKNALGYYTSINKELLTFVAKLHFESKNQNIASNLISYSNLLLAKERMGIERAVGTNILAKNMASIQLKNKFVSLISEQNSYLDSFNNSATQENIIKLENILSSSANQNVNKIRKLILSKNENYNYDSATWFRTITEKIKLIKKLDFNMSDNMIEKIEYYEDSALNRFAIEAISGLLVVLLTIFIMYNVIINIENSLKLFQEGLNNFFKFLLRETKDTTTIALNGKDEFAQMAKVLNGQVITTRISIEKDYKVLDEIDDIIQKASNGFLGYKIESVAGSEEVGLISSKINNFLDELNQKINLMTTVLLHYGKNEFNYKLNDTDNFKMQGNFAVILDALLLLGTNTSELFAQLHNASDSLTISNQTLNQNASNLAQSSNNQATSLEETAAALEEITTTINANSQKIIEASNRTENVELKANDGEKLAKQTTQSMDNINEQIKNISESISVIDQIAFQTNILSLNAAVEAATAGEAGKGFAVVAQEVRNLASRSADAANEIKGIVQNATEKANEGKEIAYAMIEGYSELKIDISKTKDDMEDIANSSKEQSESIEQINTAVNELDVITQQNAAVANDIQQLTSTATQLAQNLQSVATNAIIDDKYKKMVSDTNLLSNISARKSDHILFLDSNFNKLKDYKDIKVVDGHSCKLGKWIDKVEQEGCDFTKTQNWSQLKETHVQAHDNMQKMISKNSQHASNDEINSIGIKLNKNIQGVFEHLDQIKVDGCSI